jgi:hypothetical protein
LLSSGPLAEDAPEPTAADFGPAATTGRLPGDYFTTSDIRRAFISPENP